MNKTNSQPLSGTPAESPGTPNQGGQITPELVRQVADKVYALLVKELCIEKERRRLEATGRNILPGGYGWTQ